MAKTERKTTVEYKNAEHFLHAKTSLSPAAARDFVKSLTEQERTKLAALLETRAHAHQVAAFLNAVHAARHPPTKPEAVPTEPSPSTPVPPADDATPSSKTKPKH